MGTENIFYGEEVLGKAGKRIVLYKFRSMKVDADKDLEAVLKNGFDELGKIRDDPRITPFGKFLRRYWIDELPQFYNLLRGDIKLVGIRAKPEKFWALFPKDQMEHALKYKPGLIGIVYAHKEMKDFKDFILAEKNYLEQKDNHPYLTDLKY